MPMYRRMSRKLSLPKMRNNNQVPPVSAADSARTQIEQGVPASAIDLRSLGRDALVGMVREGNIAWYDAAMNGDKDIAEHQQANVDEYLGALSRMR